MGEIVLGIDVGATGTKGALVDLEKGELVSDRIKFPTPQSHLPKDMIDTIGKLVDEFSWRGKPIGLGFPAVIMNNKTITASNIDKAWLGYEISLKMNEYLESPVVVINDADAAGLAEITYSNNEPPAGTLILLTLGTGIGSAIFLNGKLLKNTELGHTLYQGKIAEKIVSNSARLKNELSWEEYGSQLGEYLSYINRLFYPELFILGGGISKKFEKYAKYFPSHLNVRPATQLNNAGIIGAALAFKLYA